jgi:hypothetical protein
MLHILYTTSSFTVFRFSKALDEELMSHKRGPCLSIICTLIMPCISLMLSRLVRNRKKLGSKITREHGMHVKSRKKAT